MQILAPLTRSQCRVSDTSTWVTVKVCGPLVNIAVVYQPSQDRF